MKKIYTKTGDEGTTSIRGGIRLPKDDIRIEANGMLDEANAQIGICRTLLSATDERQSLLHDIQVELMVIMSHIATPEGKTNPKQLHVTELTQLMETMMDELYGQLDEQRHFILPGGTPFSAQLHFARTLVRTAERRLWTLHRQSPVNGDILCFINRLSDWLFVLARADMQRNNCLDEPFLSTAK